MSTFLNDLHKHSYDLDRQITQSLTSLLLEPDTSSRFLQSHSYQATAPTAPTANLAQQMQSNLQLQNSKQILIQSNSKQSFPNNQDITGKFQQSYLRQRDISKCIKSCQEMLNSLLLKSTSAKFTKKSQNSQHLGSVITKDDDSIASSRSSAIDECMNEYDHNTSNVSSTSNSLACTPRFLQSKQGPQNKSNSLNSSKQQDDSFRLLQQQQQLQLQQQQQQDQQKFLLQVGIKIVNAEATTTSNSNIRTLTASSSVASFEQDEEEDQITKKNQKRSNSNNQLAPRIELDSQKLKQEFQFREQENTNKMMKQIGRLLHAVNAERKLFRDQNMKLLNKIATLQMQGEQAKITKLENNYLSFTSRAYRMHQQIKDKRIEKLENQNKLLRESGFSMATQCVDLQNQINQFQETFQDRLKQAAILMSCQNINSPDQLQSKERQFLHIPSQKIRNSNNSHAKMYSFSSSSRSSSCFGSKAPSPIRAMNSSSQSKESLIFQQHQQQQLQHNKKQQQEQQRRPLTHSQTKITSEKNQSKAKLRKLNTSNYGSKTSFCQRTPPPLNRTSCCSSASSRQVNHSIKNNNRNNKPNTYILEGQQIFNSCNQNYSMRDSFNRNSNTQQSNTSSERFKSVKMQSQRLSKLRNKFKNFNQSNNSANKTSCVTPEPGLNHSKSQLCSINKREVVDAVAIRTQTSIGMRNVGCSSVSTLRLNGEDEIGYNFEESSSNKIEDEVKSLESNGGNKLSMQHSTPVKNNSQKLLSNSVNACKIQNQNIAATACDNMFKSPEPNTSLMIEEQNQYQQQQHCKKCKYNDCNCYLHINSPEILEQQQIDEQQGKQSRFQKQLKDQQNSNQDCLNLSNESNHSNQFCLNQNPAQDQKEIEDALLNDPQLDLLSDNSSPATSKASPNNSPVQRAAGVVRQISLPQSSQTSSQRVVRLIEMKKLVELKIDDDVDNGQITKTSSLPKDSNVQRSQAILSSSSSQAMLSPASMSSSSQNIIFSPSLSSSKSLQNKMSSGTLRRQSSATALFLSKNNSACNLLKSVTPTTTATTTSQSSGRGEDSQISTNLLSANKIQSRNCLAGLKKQSSLGIVKNFPKTPKLQEAQYKLRSRMTEVVSLSHRFVTNDQTSSSNIINNSTATATSSYNPRSSKFSQQQYKQQQQSQQQKLQNTSAAAMTEFSKSSLVTTPKIKSFRRQQSRIPGISGGSGFKNLRNQTSIGPAQKIGSSTPSIGANQRVLSQKMQCATQFSLANSNSSGCSSSRRNTLQQSKVQSIAEITRKNTINVDSNKCSLGSNQEPSRGDFIKNSKSSNNKRPSQSFPQQKQKKSDE